jgi:hypothetical protein
MIWNEEMINTHLINSEPLKKKTYINYFLSKVSYIKSFLFILFHLICNSIILISFTRFDSWIAIRNKLHSKKDNKKVFLKLNFISIS